VSFALAGCGPQPTRLTPVERLVEAVPAAEPARAAIVRDLRPVLRAFPAARIHHGSVTGDSERRVQLRLPLPPALREARRLVLRPFVKPSSQPGYHRPLQAEAVVVRRGAGGSWVRLDRNLADLERSAESASGLDLFVEVTEPPADRVLQLETRTLEIPPAAELGFSIGILESAWEQGPVHFELQACQMRHGGRVDDEGRERGPDAASRCETLFAEQLDPGGPGGGAWRERRVPLAGLGGTRRSLRFETRFEGRGSFTFPVWGDPTLLAPRPRRRGDLSLILVSIDTLRADHLASYGYPRETAPFLDRMLAAEGMLFETVVSAATTTGPSHMTLFTSLQPSVHSIRRNSGAARLPRSVPTLAELLRGRGFATGAVTEGGGVGARRGFERGFGRFVENPTPIPNRPGAQSAVSFPRALDWVRSVGDRRFFLFLHTYEVHGPYRAPLEYQSLFQDEPSGTAAGPLPLPLKRQPVLYDREIRYADDGLRDFVAGLAAAGRLDDTLLVVTSDHGEEFLDHGNLGHGATPYEEVLRVPLLFRGPGVPAGRRIPAPLGLVDLMPTLLELVGVPVPAGVTGRSFADLVRGEGGDGSGRERPLYSEAWFRWAHSPTGLRPVEQPTLSVRLGDRKLIRFRRGEGHRYEYYDLARDPDEQRDLYPQQPAAAADLRALLDGYEASALEQRRALLDEDAGDAPLLDPDHEESLRALGYVD